MTRQSSPSSFAVLAGAVLGGGLLIFVAGRALTSHRKSEPPAGPSDYLSSKFLIARPCKLADGLYLLGDTFPAAVYVLDTTDGLIMIDAGLEAEYEKIVDGLSLLGLDLKRLKLILLTHVHGDHSMGAERLRLESGAKVCIGREDAKPLRQGGPWEAIFSKFDMPGVSPHPGTVDVELVDGQTLTLGDLRITAIATPGHTPGSFCFLAERGEQRLFFAGDVVTSLNDGLGTYSTYLPPKYRSVAGDYLASLKELRDLPAPDMLLPGHPRAGSVPQNPWLSATQWEALLNGGIMELEQLIQRYDRDGADFLDGTPRQIAEGLYYLGDFGERAVYAVLYGEQLLFLDACGEGVAEFVAAAWAVLGVSPPAAAAIMLTSCRAEAINGLPELFDASPCRVVASPGGREAVRQACPGAVFVASDEIASLQIDGLQAITLSGCDETAVAYYFTLDNRRILVTGDIPIEVDGAVLPRILEAVLQEDFDQVRFSEDLDKLQRIQPDIWLSARPLFGRNANIYDDAWSRTLASNQWLFGRAKAARRPPAQPKSRLQDLELE